MTSTIKSAQRWTLAIAVALLATLAVGSSAAHADTGVSCGPTYAEAWGQTYCGSYNLVFASWANSVSSTGAQTFSSVCARFWTTSGYIGGEACDNNGAGQAAIFFSDTSGWGVAVNNEPYAHYLSNTVWLDN